MKTFLEYVAQDIIAKHGSDLGHVAIVFPNKRASLFMNNALAKITGKPMWSPAYFTISDLFRHHSALHTADDIKLICDLHKVFVECTGLKNETLDKFYGWGQLLLTDFDDIDKNMADADKVFANLKDIHALDDVSYLSEKQKEVLKKFFSNFSDEHNTHLKEKFLSLWQHFGDIYHKYNDTLVAQGLAYEGSLYRKVVESENADFLYDTYIFVGFNMMQKVELKLLDKLSALKKARFYWDFDRYYMDGKNEAGVYIRQLLKYYPNELDNGDDGIYGNFIKAKDITYISAPTENIQARYIATWLRQNGRIEAGARTAVVMADENLLQTVIHSLPPEVDKVNITTGYPLAQSPFASLVAQLIQLQTIGHKVNTDTYRLHYVNLLLRHPYSALISDKHDELVEDLKKNLRFYPTRESLSLDASLALLFKDIDHTDDGDTTAKYDRNLALCKWLLEILKTIGINFNDRKENGKDNNGLGDPLFEESLFRMYTLINRLCGLIASGDLNVNIATFQRLMTQLINTTSIPFHGEPAIGIQIMGVLETRNLDFDHVLLLSCNEGNLPKGVNDASFIPYSIRKAYELTTIDNKVAIYAYYFHSLLQRASDISISYNNSTSGTQTGEMSRFMLQLMVESEHDIKRLSLKAGQQPVTHNERDIAKDEKTMKVLDGITAITPTAINTYIRCQQRFFYKYVAGIKEPDEMDIDEIDNRIFGNIFHKAAEKMYLSFAKKDNLKRDKKGELELIRPLPVTHANLKLLLDDKSKIERIVDETFQEELFKVKAGGFKPEYNGLQLINRTVIIDYLKRLIDTDIKLTPFMIIGLEKKVEHEVDIDGRKLKVGGIIDRLDAVGTGSDRCMRVIDYKTGNKPSKKINNIEGIFDSQYVSTSHSDYFLQTILYSLVVSNDKTLNAEASPVSPALLFIQHISGDDYDPTLEINGEKVKDAEPLREEFSQHLREVLKEIFDPYSNFIATPFKDSCKSCPYATLCK